MKKQKSGSRTPDTLTETQILIVQECNYIRDLLLEKNRSYGNSALKPLRIFSRSSSLEQLRVRIDDKLSRIARGKKYKDEVTTEDLLGYLVLYRVKKKMKKLKKEKKNANRKSN